MKHYSVLALSFAGLSAVIAGCGSSAPNGGEGSLTGEITIDGSSTVYPIETALQELFSSETRGVRFTVGQSGTGSGFEKLANGEIDIAGASRPVKESELVSLAQAGIDFVEVPVAFDGLSIIVSPDNSWLDQITVEQLNMIWDEDSIVKNWSDIDPSYPSEPITLFGPTSAHGTFDYFNEAINGDSKNTRQDYEKCAEYNTLVNGVANGKYALGYVGFSYYVLNKDKLKVIPVVNGMGQAVVPSSTTIMDGTYEPLSRPLMIYVNAESLARPEVLAFVEYAVKDGDQAVEATGYIPLPSDVRDSLLDRVRSITTGSVLNGVAPGTKLSDVLDASK